MGDKDRDVLLHDLEGLLKDDKIFGYKDELQSANGFEELLDTGAITDQTGKRIPMKRGRDERGRADVIGKILEKGGSLYIYKKGDLYPREVRYDTESNRLTVNARTLKEAKPLVQPKKPLAIVRLVNSIAHLFGTRLDSCREWDRYNNQIKVRENMESTKRLDRRRRNDTILNRRSQAANTSKKNAFQSLESMLKGQLGYSREFAEKGNMAMEDLLRSGRIVDEKGEKLNVPEDATPEQLIETIGQPLYKKQRPLYIYKPGEKYPHEVYLNNQGKLVLSEETIDKMYNDVRKPGLGSRMADWGRWRNQRAFDYERANIRKALIAHEQVADVRKNDPVQQPAPEEKPTKPLEEASVEKVQEKQPEPAPKQEEPAPAEKNEKPLTLEEQREALRRQLEELDKQIAAQKNEPQVNQPQKDEPQVKEPEKEEPQKDPRQEELDYIRSHLKKVPEEPEVPAEEKNEPEGPAEKKDEPEGPTEKKDEPEGPTEKKDEPQGPVEGQTEPEEPADGKTETEEIVEGADGPEEPAQGQDEPQDEAKAFEELVNTLKERNGGQDLTENMYENLWQLFSDAEQGRNLIADAVVNPDLEKFSGGSAVSAIVAYENMKKSLLEHTQEMLPELDKPGCAAKMQQLTRLSPNVVYAADYMHDRNFYIDNVLSSSGVQQLSDTVDQGARMVFAKQSLFRQNISNPFWRPEIEAEKMAMAEESKQPPVSLGKQPKLPVQNQPQNQPQNQEIKPIQKASQPAGPGFGGMI